MKITKRFEVWVGDDLVEDILDYDQAKELAKKEFAEYGDKASVVIDEITHYTIESIKDLEDLDNNLQEKFVSKEVRVATQEELDNILADAFESGISHWCDAIRIDKEPNEEYKHFSDVLTREGTLELHDMHQDVWLKLDIKKFLNALSNCGLNMDDYDSDDADEVIQCAVLGEVVYA